jgi:hypothetical protein
MARLWETDPHARILSDDRVIVRHIEGRYWMYGTPWHGEAPLAAAVRAPLTHVFLLRHSRVNQASPVSKVDATTQLFACCFPPFHSSSGVAFVLDMLGAVSSALPCAELGFAPDADVKQFVRRLAI